MPDDFEILWVEHIVYVQPVSERAVDWLQQNRPHRRPWSMRMMGHEELELFVNGARRNGLTVGGVKMPVDIEDMSYDW